MSVAWTADQFRQVRGISKFFAKGDRKGAVHLYVGKVVGVGRHVWYLIASIVEMNCMYFVIGLSVQIVCLIAVL